MNNNWFVYRLWTSKFINTNNYNWIFKQKWGFVLCHNIKSVNHRDLKLHIYYNFLNKNSIFRVFKLILNYRYQFITRRQRTILLIVHIKLHYVVHIANGTLVGIDYWLILTNNLILTYKLIKINMYYVYNIKYIFI